MTVSEYIFDFLQKKGADTVYMVSGSSAMWLTDALKRNERLHAICCQHEQAAAMAADGYGRTSGGVPGVCLVTIGPGATNAITGVAGAFVDSSPMFVISGQANSRMLREQIDTGLRQKGTQSLNLAPLVSGITKYFAAVMSERDARYHVERAWHEATTGRSGPVWLDVPVDIQNKQIPEEMKGFTPRAEGKTEIAEFDKIKRLLSRAERPLILAGYGVIGAGVTDAVRAFAERFQIPVVTSRGGIGCIDSGHPLFVGRPGSYGDRASHFAIQECDLLLILGSRLAVSTVGYYPDRFAMRSKKVMVDIDGKELAKAGVPIDIAVEADLSTFIPELNRRSAQEAWKVPAHEAWLERCAKNKHKYPVVLDRYQEEPGINAYVFTKRLSENVPQEAAVVVDTGSVCNVVSQAWVLKRGQRYVISGGLSCMGFWAAAIGTCAHLKNVVALSGDGATQMNVQEFATLAYYHLPIKLFVYNNKGYMLIRHNQHNYMHDRFLGVGPDSGVPSVDFCAVAQAYGLPCVRISSKDEIEEKVKKVLGMEGPVICEVMTQEFGVLAPRIASKVMPDGSLKAAEYDDLWPFLEKDDDV